LTLQLGYQYVAGEDAYLPDSSVGVFLEKRFVLGFILSQVEL
jgi:hypothetical protein